MEGNRLFVPQAALTDEAYRQMVRQGVMPQRVACPQCSRLALFADDALAARYECAGGHATAAMYADPVVVGGGALA